MARNTITVRVSDDLLDDVDEAADEAGVSRSEYVRERLREKDEIETLEAKVERLSERLESREERIDTLEQQLARRSQIEEKVDTLAKRQESPDAPFFVKWARWFRRRGER
jgi:predicted DNA binding CopG/RHH family protein